MKQNSSDIKNKVFFSLMFILAFFINSVFTPGISFKSGFNAINAELLLAMSIVCGILCEDRKTVSVIALISGVVSDILITPPIHLSPILFFAAAYFSPKMISYFVKTNALYVTVASIPFLLARTAAGFIFLASRLENVSFVDIFLGTLLPELAVNMLTVFAVYIIVSFIYKRVKRKFYIM